VESNCAGLKTRFHKLCPSSPQPGITSIPNNSWTRAPTSRLLRRECVSSLINVTETERQKGDATEARQNNLTLHPNSSASRSILGSTISTENSTALLRAAVCAELRALDKRRFRWRRGWRLLLDDGRRRRRLLNGRSLGLHLLNLRTSSDSASRAAISSLS